MKGSKRLRSFYKLKYGFAWCVLLAMLSFLTFSFIAKTIEDIRGLQNHPIKAEVSLKLIKPCLAMGMDVETKELYSNAMKTLKSDDALASWARILLQDVRRQLGDELKE